MDIESRIEELERRVTRLELLHEIEERRRSKILKRLERFGTEIKEIHQSVKEELDKKVE